MHLTTTLLGKLPCKEGYALLPGASVVPARPMKYGTAWHQPRRNDLRFHVDSRNPESKPDLVYMSQKSRNDLSDYSRSMPTSVYPGKMWKAECTRLDGSKEWRLRWYGEVPGRRDICSNNECPIVLLEIVDLLVPS
ncbi:MAG TPA: hypothetical protein VM783_07825 [Candidatus Acidoferrum sp.]|nr:hypothetical protein [Candidatus Acidoferrum sp.]